MDASALYRMMASQHGAASSRQARTVGVTAAHERALIRNGVLRRPVDGVLALAGATPTFRHRCMAAALAPGVVAVSHGAAARVHRLDGFDRYEQIDVIGTREQEPSTDAGIVVHRTRGPVRDHVVTVESIPVLDVPLTLSLLAPHAGISRTAKALDSALRSGHDPRRLRRVAAAWRRRGRSGPPALLMLLGERVDKTLPRSWFQRIAKRLFDVSRIRLVDEYELRDERGVVLAVLDLADPVRRVGVECQSWRWHATPSAQHRDARRRGMVRQLGWEIVDVWWSDLRHPERVLAELRYLLDSRTPAA